MLRHDKLMEAKHARGTGTADELAMNANERRGGRGGGGGGCGGGAGKSKFSGKCHSCGKEGHKAAVCRGKG